MTGSQIKVFCVDDNASDLRLLELLLEVQDDLHFVGGSASTDNIVAMVRATKADVVVLDLRLRGQDALEAIDEIKDQCKTTAVVTYSGFNDPSIRSEVLDRGASAFVTKDGDSDKLFAAIRAAFKSVSAD